MSTIDSLTSELDKIVCPTEILVDAMMQLEDEADTVPHTMVAHAYQHVSRNALGYCGCFSCMDARFWEE